MREGKKGAIHVLFSLQARTSYREDLCHSHNTFQAGKCCKKTACRCKAIPLDKDTMEMLNAPNDALAGPLKQQHPMGPIVWEQTQNEQDVYYCENNIISTNIVGCASNSSPITSTTSGKATKEYMSKYGKRKS